MSLQPPKPEEIALYPTWQIWGKRLLDYLKRTDELRAQSPSHQLPTYFATALPSAAQAGLQIFILDEDNAAVSTSTGGWKRLRFVT